MEDHISKKNIKIKKISKSKIDLSIKKTSLLLSDQTLSNIVEIMKKNPNTLNSKELYILHNTIEKTDIISLFKKENVIDQDNINKIIMYLINNMVYENRKPNSIIFNYNEIGKKFYIILQGKVSILKPVKREFLYNIYEYCNHLINYKLSNNYLLLNLTIEENKSIFPIKLPELEKFHKTIIKINIMNMLKSVLSLIKKKFNLIDFINSINEINLLIKENKEILNLQELLISDDIDKIIQNVNDLNNEIISSEYDLSSFSHNLEFYKEIYNNNTINNDNRKNFIIFEYENVLTLTDNQNFGTSSMGMNSSRRNATAMTETECHLLSFHENVYKQILKNEVQKVLNIQISYFNDLIIFQSIKRITFGKCYFSNIVYKKYSRNDIICFEDNIPKKIYIIKEGRVEVKINKNLYEIKNLIQHIYNTVPNLEVHQQKNIKSYINLKEIKEYKNFQILNLIEKDIIGIEEFIYNMSNLSTITVISDTAIIYSIDISVIYKILKFESDAAKDINKFAFEKISIIYKRLIDIDKLMTDKIIKNYNDEKKLNKNKSCDFNNGIELIKKNLNVLKKDVSNFDDYSNYITQIKNNFKFKRNDNLCRMNKPISLFNRTKLNNQFKKVKFEDKLIKKLRKSFGETFMNICEIHKIHDKSESNSNSFIKTESFIVKTQKNTFSNHLSPIRITKK